MRGVRFNKAETELLLWWLGRAEEWGPATGKKGYGSLCLSIISKLQGASAPAAPKVNVGPIEDVLVASSRGRVIKLAGGGGYARASVQATNVGATVADARVVGEWLARQGWWKQGPTTILTVLTRWPEWLAKARASTAPDLHAAKPGFK